MTKPPPKKKSASKPAAPEPPPLRVIRDRAFAQRLALASDGNSHVPPLNHGRLTWVKTQLDARFKESVSVETVRKWYAGEVKPRPEKVTLLAQLLEVDESWLSLGIDPELAPRDQKVRNAVAGGAVNVLAGFIQMNGGHPAFPDPGDKRAQDAHIDLYAIIRGAQYAFHVALAQETDDGFRFTVPAQHEDTFQIGVVLLASLEIALIELTPDTIAAGKRQGASIDVTVSRKDLVAKRIKTLRERL
ncbi:MAG TPA: hypothetical protein VGL66_19685 [Caulobacteraceae bacterium]|jgi:hypothetical protein